MKSKFVIFHPAVALLSLALVACGGDDDGLGLEPLPAGDAIVVAVGSNFTDTSAFTRIVLPQEDIDIAALDGVVSTDPKIRKRGDYLIVVNRFGFDNVTVLDASSFDLVAQVSTGAGSNPQDAALDGDMLYVADAAGTGLSVIDLGDPGAGATPIDLSSLDPDDGVPNCHAVEIVDGDVWVSCGVRDDTDPNLVPRGPGIIAVVDATSGNLSTSFELEHASPTGFFLPSAPSAGAEVYIATVPDFFAPADDGCIETLVPGAQPESDGCLVENQDLGGYVADMVWTGGGIAAAVVTGFDPDDFGALGTVYQIEGVGGNLNTVELASPDRSFDIAICPEGELVISVATAGVALGIDADPVDIGAPPVEGGTVCY